MIKEMHREVKIPSRYFHLREGTRQAGMLAFPFADAREREKLAERVSHVLGILVGKSGNLSRRILFQEISFDIV